ncbi:unnamed protein product [Notodromas monacha]|uniref:Chitin-binding type-2 domain-containing protein n=1 Tax=Notodromas monacha TaxID=399045 RepID=A0A7R9GIK9_9CRUS|nr:unnamed protein product [Notodromas monacha]CAG0924071.1 unnamed protein product [Notodromas monacha]
MHPASVSLLVIAVLIGTGFTGPSLAEKSSLSRGITNEKSNNNNNNNYSIALTKNRGRQPRQNVPKPGSLSRPTIQVPPKQQEQRLRIRNEEVDRVFSRKTQDFDVDELPKTTTEKISVISRAIEENVVEPLGLSSGAFSLFGNAQTTFSCDGKPYGYYADVDNGCRIFHICQSSLTESDAPVTRWSFFCGGGTVFNQATLVCDFPENSPPCETSPEYHKDNDAFFKLSPS